MSHDHGHSANRNRLSIAIAIVATVLVVEVVGAYAGRIVPFDEQATRSFAEVVSTRESTGHRIGVADAMIAAIAMSHGLALATRNTKDFSGLPIALIDPWL